MPLVHRVVPRARPGKTIPDGVAEVREACRFPALLPLAGAQAVCMPRINARSDRRVHTSCNCTAVACLPHQPVELPLVIFRRQIAAGAAAGNSVIATPAEQTNLIGFAACRRLLHEAGLPESGAAVLFPDGATVGAALTTDPRVAGVAFTCSNRHRAPRSIVRCPHAMRRSACDRRDRRPELHDRDSSAFPNNWSRTHWPPPSPPRDSVFSRARTVRPETSPTGIGMLAGAMAELAVATRACSRPMSVRSSMSKR